LENISEDVVREDIFERDPEEVKILNSELRVYKDNKDVKVADLNKMLTAMKKLNKQIELIEEEEKLESMDVKDVMDNKESNICLFRI
jgi:hypothetical protein